MIKQIFSYSALALLMVLGMGHVFAQTKQTIKKENRIERLKFEQLMYRNPVTKQIPAGIREKELNFAYGSKAQLMPAFKKSERGLKGVDNTGFQIRGPFNVGGRTRAIGIDIRNTEIRLIGGATGGLYRTTNGGTSWTLVSDAIANPSITGVAQDPTNPDTWYYISGEMIGTVTTDVNRRAFYFGDGVYKSTDNGVTWSQLPSTVPANSSSFGGTNFEWQYSHDIAIDPIDGAILVANIGGIYRSADGGATWTEVLDATITNTLNISHIDVQKTSESTRVYYATTHDQGENKGFFTSTDGQTWNKIDNPASMPAEWHRIEVAIAPSNSDAVWFFLSFRNQYLRLYKYDNATATWTDRSANLPALGGFVGDLNTQSSYNMVMAVKPDDEDYIFVAGTNLYRSSDGFATPTNAENTGNSQWIGGYSPDNNVRSYPNHHPDVHSLAFIPGSNTAVLCGHDGGISETNDITSNHGVPGSFNIAHPVTWATLNNGYYTTQAYSVAIDPTTSGDKRMMLGFQDNSNWLVNDDSPTALWGLEIAGGDGCFNAIVAGEDTRYHSTQFGSVLRVTGTNPSNPTSGNHVHPAAATGQLFVNPFILDKNDQDIMYYPAGPVLWRHNTVSTINTGFNFGGTNDPGWNILTSAAVANGNITSLEVSKSPANVLYYGTSVGQVFKLTDANTGTAPVQTDITGTDFPANAFVSSISVDDDDADKVLVTFSNYGILSIFYSTDGGTSWINVSGNLEENPDGTGDGPSVRSIAFHNLSNGEEVYYAGTSTGLYYTETLNGANTVWTFEAANTIGNVPVAMIQTRTIDGLVAVATHGKGAFSAIVTSSTPPVINTLSPANGAIGVNSESILSITFDKTVEAGSGNITIKNNEDDATVASFAINDSQIAIKDNVVTITPTNELPSNTQLYVTIDPGTFRNTAGDNFAGIAEKDVWSFTTFAIPMVSSFIPTNGANDVNTTNPIAITFEENVVAGSGNITIKKNDDDAVVASYAATASTIQISGSTVTITPENNLPRGTQLYVEIDPGTFVSTAGSEFPGISGKTTWSFSTDVISSIIEQSDFALKLYPNPATDAVTIHLGQLNFLLAKVELYNLNGEIVSEKLLKPIHNNGLEGTINLQGLPKGGYIIKVITPQDIISRSLIVK